MQTARAEDGSELLLHTDSDNWAALQAFIDAHDEVLLPAGVFPITKTINLSTNDVLRGMGAEHTTLKKIGSTTGPVVGAAGAGAWPGSEGRNAQTGISLYGLTMWQTTDTHVLDKCMMIHEGCNDFRAENFRCKGSKYEGIVVSSSVLGCTLRNFECIDCGNGGDHYAFSTAGMNATCGQLVVEDFRIRGCGQGVETGNTDVVVRRGHISDPGTGLPSIGINVGSTGYGVYNVVIEYCTVAGYDFAIGCGNGIGRLAKVIIRHNKIYDEGGVDETQAAPIGFAGGNPNNNVQHDHQGPDTEGSEITDNEIHVTIPHQGAIIYNSSPNQDGTWGREPLAIARNKIYMEGVSSEQTHPLVNFAGEVSGACIVEGNEFFGLDDPPDRGDIQSNSLTGNPAIPGMPNLTVRGNFAYNTNGKYRDMLVNIEGA